MNIDKISEQAVTRLLYEEMGNSNEVQLNGENLQKLRDILDQSGILYTEEKIECENLEYTKQEIGEDEDDRAIIDELKEKIKEENTIFPIIVSQDYYVLDGHKRCEAVKESKGEDYRLPVFRVHLPKLQALSMLSDAVIRIREGNDEMDTVVVYGGRFQPFHIGHYKTYEELTNKFGVNNVYIATSNKVERNKSPLNFKQKKKIISKMFDIPDRMVVQTKNPYRPEEILSDFDEDKTVYIAALGQKDANRLKNGKYFEKYESSNLEPYSEKGYYYPVKKKVLKIDGQPVSGTIIRSKLSSDSLDEEMKKALFKAVYDGKFNQEIYDMLKNNINERILPTTIIENFILTYSINEFLNENDSKGKQLVIELGKKATTAFNIKVSDPQKLYEIGKSFVVGSNTSKFGNDITHAKLNIQKRMLKETSTTSSIGRLTGVAADDGPTTWYRSSSNYQEAMDVVAQDLGYEVIDHLMDGARDLDGEYDYLKKDGLKFVSFYTTGVHGEDMVSNPDRIYYAYVNALSKTLGYEIINYLGLDLAEPDDKDGETQSDRETKKTSDEKIFEIKK